MIGVVLDMAYSGDGARVRTDSAGGPPVTRTARATRPGSSPVT
ncbi:hypothetical protein NKH77_34545 [Streptomyces sp. M19]